GSARDRVETIIGRGKRVVLGEMRLTPRAKKVIELAVDEAKRLNHDYIGTEHLLLGLLREGHGIGAGVLEDLGVSLNKARYEVMRILDDKISRRSVNTHSRSFLVTLMAVIITIVAIAALRRRISGVLFR